MNTYLIIIFLWLQPNFLSKILISQEISQAFLANEFKDEIHFWIHVTYP